MIILTIIACIFMYIQAKKVILKSIKSDLGVKTVLISDLHFDISLVDRKKIIDMVSGEEPEIIAITGDLCSNMKNFHKVEDFLRNLSERNSCPILITLGNHDNKIFKNTGYSKEEYIKNLEKTGNFVRVLENDEFEYKDVLFCGLGDIKTNQEDCGKLTKNWHQKAKEKNKKFVLLTHNPDMALHIDSKNAPDIMLSGHTHGGQMKIPFNIEFALLKKDILPKKKIFYGEKEYNGIKMYITSGIGCSGVPFRFRSVAEIAVFKSI